MKFSLNIQSEDREDIQITLKAQCLFSAICDIHNFVRNRLKHAVVTDDEAKALQQILDTTIEFNDLY